MATKTEIEEEINEKLDTDIEWSQLNKDDLEKFGKLLDDDEFVKLVVANYAGDTAGGLTKTAVTGWKPGKGFAVLTDDDASVMDLFF